MSRQTWALIKENKNFNVNIYRRGILTIIGSVILSGLFGLLSFYIYLHEPERDYYASNGVTGPVKLQALWAPNASQNALLPPDPPGEEVQRVIPE